MKMLEKIVEFDKENKIANYFLDKDISVAENYQRDILDFIVKNYSSDLDLINDSLYPNFRGYEYLYDLSQYNNNTKLAILKIMIKHSPSWNSNRDNSIILHNVFDNLDTEQAQDLVNYCFNDTTGSDLRQTLDNSVFTKAFYSYVNDNKSLRDIYCKYLFDKTETNIYDLSTDPKECEKYFNQYHQPKSVVVGGLLVGLATRNLELFYSGCRTLDTIPDKSTIKTSRRNRMKRNLDCLDIIKQWGLDNVITTQRITIDEYSGYQQTFDIQDKQLLQLVILCMCLLDREQARYYHPRKTLTQKLGSNLRSLCELYDWERDKIFKRVIPTQFSQFFDLPSEN